MFLFSSVARDTPDSDNDAMCAELKKDEGWKKSVNNSRPTSVASEPERNDRWIDIVSGEISKKNFVLVQIYSYNIE